MKNQRSETWQVAMRVVCIKRARQGYRAEGAVKDEFVSFDRKDLTRVKGCQYQIRHQAWRL